MQSQKTESTGKKRDPHAVPRVALLIETSNGYARSILHGVEDFIRNHQPWHIFLAERRRGDSPPKWLENWHGDGVIARIENKNTAQVLSRLRVPVVDLSSYRYLPEVPGVMTDGAAIAEMAAMHFLNRGFEHFAYCGVPRFPWSRQRGEHFLKILHEKQIRCHCYHSTQKSGDDNEHETDDIARWLLDLPKPVAVFACYDARGRQILDACHRARLSVPEEVAVLGVDDDELLCELSPQPLSSIDPNPRRCGWVAAEMLEMMMAGQNPDPLIQVVTPIGISTRQSTDVFAIEDVNLVKALRFIREHACRGISVDEVARVAGLARRTMEARFKKMLDRSPHEEIMRIQVMRAQRLLLYSNLPIALIAERVGFETPEYFSVAFKRITGMPPVTYRKKRGEVR